MTNLMHWRLLVAVADLGCVSTAAGRHGITQSGASQAISQMEETLGVKVFVRDRRKTTVTAIGEQVIERARRMLAEWASIRALVDESRGLHAGGIRLASFASIFTTLLPDFLRSFRELHPGIEIVSLEGTDDEIEAWLAANTIDVGVVMNPRPERDALVFGRDAWVAVLPAAHALARRPGGTGLPLAELVAQPFVLATGGCDLTSKRLVERAGLALSDVRISVRDWSTAFALIREGVGLSLVPESTLPDNRRGLRVFGLDTPLYREFGLVCSERARHAPAVRVFLEQLHQHAGRKPAAGTPLRPRLAPPVGGPAATASAARRVCPGGAGRSALS